MKVDLLLETLFHHSSLSSPDTHAFAHTYSTWQAAIIAIPGLETKWRNIQPIFRCLECNLAAANRERQQLTSSLLETTVGNLCTTISHPEHTSHSWVHPQKHSRCGSSTDRWIKMIPTHWNGKHRPPTGQKHTKVTEETPCKEQAHRLVCSAPTCCINPSFPLSHPSVPPGMQPATSPSSHLDAGPGDSMCLAATGVHCNPSKDLCVCVNGPEKVHREKTATEFHSNLCARTKRSLSDWIFHLFPSVGFCNTSKIFLSLSSILNFYQDTEKIIVGKLLREQTQHNQTKITS